MSILDILKGKNSPKNIERREQKQKEFVDQLATAIKNTIKSIDCKEISKGLDADTFGFECVKTIKEVNSTNSVNFQLPGYNKSSDYVFSINIDLRNKNKEIILYNSFDRDVTWKIADAKMAQDYICDLIKKFINVQIKVAQIEKE